MLPRTRRAWLHAIISLLLVLGGISMASVTALARHYDRLELARVAAIASLIFVALIVIFVLPPLFRSARVEIATLDLPFSISAGGWLFIAILIVVAFAAGNTGNNLLFLIFSVLVSALFIAWAAGRIALRDLQVQARFPDHIFAGESAPVLVAVNNAKQIWPSISILVEARIVVSSERAKAEKRTLAHFTYVPARARVEQRVEQNFAKRGRLIVTGFDLSTRFPFGFFRLRRRLRTREVEIIVYPKPEPLGDELHLLPIAIGQTQSMRRGAGHDLYSLRDYQPHDNLRHIDWKATARARRLIVREFTAEEERRVHIVFDIASCAEECHPLRFERAVGLAASLIAHFIEERMEVRLTLGEESGGYGSGPDHLYACLRRLAVVEVPAGGRRSLGAIAFDEEYAILLTFAPHGTIPARIWRQSHVIHV